MKKFTLVDEQVERGTVTAIVGLGECEHRIKGKCADCAFMLRCDINAIIRRNARIDAALAARSTWKR